MIDIHCHILPDFDDGAADLPESLAMAHAACSCGITDIIVTPHFPGKESTLEQIPKIISRFQELENAISAEHLPLRLHPGAEILCLPQTPRMARQGRLPTLGNTNYLLCEFYFNETYAQMDGILRDLADCGYRIVVAHPERYGAIQKNPLLAEEWFRRGYVLQLNKGSLTGAFGQTVQRAAQQLLSQGLYHLVASDAHGANTRTVDMRLVRQLLEKRCPKAYARILLEKNPQRLLQGEDMTPSY